MSVSESDQPTGWTFRPGATVHVFDLPPAGSGAISSLTQHELQQARARETAFRAHIREMLAGMMTEPAAKLDDLPPAQLTETEAEQLACWLDRSAWLWAVEAMCVKRQQAIKCALRRINEQARARCLEAAV